MKLIIDIPDHVYEHAKNMSEDGNDEYEALRAIAKGEKTLVDISLLVQKVIEILPGVVDSVVDNIPTYINEKLKCQNCDWYKEQRPHGECKTCKHFVKDGFGGLKNVCEHPEIQLDDYYDYACIMMEENDFCSRYEPIEKGGEQIGFTD